MTKEELKTLKNDVESLSKELNELSDEELNTVTGGLGRPNGTGVMPIIFAQAIMKLPVEAVLRGQEPDECIASIDDRNNPKIKL